MTLKQSLYLYASSCDENKEQIREWFREGILKVASGQGKTVASTTGNGVSVTFMSDSMTLEDWVNTLAEVIQSLENPTRIRNKSVQVFR